MISALDDLRLVDLERLSLHEAHDEDRLARLRERMQAEEEQRNPVIVSSQGDCCLVLDGAHRVRALEELGCRLALVQFVAPPERAESWAHLLEGIGKDDVSTIEEVEIADPGEHEPLAELRTARGERLALRSREAGLPAETRALWALQALYPRGKVVRRVDPQDPAAPEDGQAVLRYRPFTPGELVEVVRSGTVLPAGITRFRVEERVLNVRYPLQKMRDGDAPARNAELRAFVQELWSENRIRYYGEPVVLFE